MITSRAMDFAVLSTWIKFPLSWIPLILLFVNLEVRCHPSHPIIQHYQVPSRVLHKKIDVMSPTQCKAQNKPLNELGARQGRHVERQLVWGEGRTRRHSERLQWLEFLFSRPQAMCFIEGFIDNSSPFEASHRVDFCLRENIWEKQLVQNGNFL